MTNDETVYTPENERLEPKNQPIEKENHLPNLHFGFHVNLPGCTESKSRLLPFLNR